MPDRVVRDEILRSERYWSVSIEAQRLFLHLLLVADDLARFSGKNYTIRSACFPGHAIDPQKLENLLSELVDVDLIRVYVVLDERYIFIPRFKQRLRFFNSKYPSPPKEINDIKIEKTDASQTQDGPESDSSPPKRREEKRSEENINPLIPPLSKKIRKPKTAKTAIPEDFGISECVRKWAAENGHGDLDERLEHFRGYVLANGKTYANWDQALQNAIRDDWAKLNGGDDGRRTGQQSWWTTEQGTLAEGRKLGLFAGAGESWADFRQRIRNAMQLQRTRRVV